jgi:hypothetical protein
MPHFVNTFDDDFLQEKTITVAESGCMIWMGGTVKGGYGKTSHKRKSLLAHRAIWEARKGGIPEGKILCHHCDVPACVNPNHLFLGTHKDNTADMFAKGREKVGEAHGSSRLSDKDVIYIRTSNDSCKQLMDRFGIHSRTIHQIKSGETWKHLL